MQRQLPIVNIEGTPFLVDVEKSELRQADSPANTISFHDMGDEGTHYTFNYDRAKRGLPPLSKPPSEDIVGINIPQMVSLDPEGMARKYGLTVEELRGKNDFDIIVDQQLLAERLSGKLPTINIAGNDFIIDLQFNELRLKNNVGNRISLINMDVSSDGERLCFFYNPTVKHIVQINPTIIVLPDDVVFIEIPNEFTLDPVGANRQYGLSDTTLLRKYPLQKNLEAKVIPLSETRLPKMIKENKEKRNKQWKPPRLIKRKKGKRF